MRVLLLSDTHLPVRVKELQPQVWQLVDEADLVIHAGDWVDEATLDALEARASRLVGVAGNNDGPALWDCLGEVARVEVEGLRIAVAQDTCGVSNDEAGSPGTPFSSLAALSAQLRFVKPWRHGPNHTTRAAHHLRCCCPVCVVLGGS